MAFKEIPSNFNHKITVKSTNSKLHLIILFTNENLTYLILHVFQKFQKVTIDCFVPFVLFETIHNYAR